MASGIGGPTRGAKIFLKFFVNWSRSMEYQVFVEGSLARETALKRT
jgi:hypothetical protein